eukprot:4762764-Lingulodinium_polyedra.AAC.1
MVGSQIRAGVFLRPQCLPQAELKVLPRLAKLTSAQQQGLAGDALTANVCAAYILAAMLCI